MAAPGTLSKGNLAAYAAPGWALALMIPPFPAILATFYATETAATAAGISLVMLLSRLLDAVTDPPMGFVSDITNSRLGPRKPWILAGSLLGMVALYAVFTPPEDAGNWYFGFAMVGYYLAYTMLNIPLRSWATELSGDYAERTKIASALTLTLLAGGLIFFLLPVVLARPEIGMLESAALDRDAMRLFAMIGVVILPLCVLWAVLGAPNGTRIVRERPSIMGFVRGVRFNKPFWIFIVGHACSGIGFGVFYAVLFLSLNTYYGLKDFVPIMLVAVVLAQLLTVPVVERLAKRTSKHKVWAWSWVAHGVLLPLVIFFPTGPESFPLFLTFSCLMAMLQTAHMVFPPAVLADIVDYDVLKTGTSRAGNYYSLFSLISKADNAVGTALGFAVIAAVGFDAKSEVNTDIAIMGLQATMAVIPAVLFLISGLILFKFPLSPARHAIIRRRIDSVNARTEPLPAGSG